MFGEIESPSVCVTPPALPDSMLTYFLVAVTGFAIFTSMCIVNWAPSIVGTDAAFGIYAFAYCFGPTLIIDSIRTSMWHQSVFGSAYALKVTMNNA